jgi:ABC-2 type transport system ATP-binding protein
MLFGLVAPDHGSIDLFGQSLIGQQTRALLAVSGFVEEPSFYPYLSGRANMELVAKLDRRPAGPSIDRALERVGLAGRGSDRVSTYSTGMRQRLGIAAALLCEPRLLLLDEPTSGLDPVGAREVALLLRQLAADGVAVLLSSHLIGEVEKICDSYTILRRGRVAWNGSAAQLRARAPASAYALATSDDEKARQIAADHARVSVRPAPAGGLALTALSDASLDAYTAALGQAGVGTRRLDMLVSPLESLFFALTSDDPLGDLKPFELAETALAHA